jgi:hypothetical protein
MAIVKATGPQVSEHTTYTIYFDISSTLSSSDSKIANHVTVGLHINRNNFFCHLIRRSLRPLQGVNSIVTYSEYREYPIVKSVNENVECT